MTRPPKLPNDAIAAAEAYNFHLRLALKLHAAAIMDSDSDFKTLLNRASDGDEWASVEIWNAYYERLVSYARQKLRGLARRDADEEDVALSAMHSFFAGARDGRLAPRDANELWKLLATITVRKATARLRKHHTEKRGGGKIRGDSAFDAAQIARSASPPETLDGLSPWLGLACEELLSSLDDGQLRDIALLRLASHTNDEIAEKLGCSRATVKRRVAEIRQCWSQR